MTTLERLNRKGKFANFCVSDWSPGDGITRYKFYNGVVS